MRHSVVLIILLFGAMLLCPAVTSCILNNANHTAYAGSEILAEETEQETEQSDDETKKLYKSKHDRKVERKTNWLEGLEGDKARIYRLYGYPSGRYREEVMGTVVERWVYPEHGVTFKFKGNTLTR